MSLVDRDGNRWQPGPLDQFQRRTLVCISGPRAGESMLDCRTDAQALGAPPPRPEPQPWIDPWEAALRDYGD